MENKFRLTIDVVFGDNHHVTLSADTPYGRMELPVVFAVGNIDGWSAMMQAMAVVEREANRRGRGGRPKHHAHCCWIVRKLGGFKKEEAVSQPIKPVMPSVISSLLH